jgi:hypothetical protein
VYDTFFQTPSGIELCFYYFNFQNSSSSLCRYWKVPVTGSIGRIDVFVVWFEGGFGLLQPFYDARHQWPKHEKDNGDQE